MKKTAHVLMCSLLICSFAICSCALCLLPGCVSAEVELTSESRATDGTVKITRKRFSTFALYREAMKQGLADAGSIAGGIMDLLPVSPSTVVSGILGLGLVGSAGYSVKRRRRHDEMLRKEKEKSFNKALTMRLGPPVPVMPASPAPVEVQS